MKKIFLSIDKFIACLYRKNLNIKNSHQPNEQVGFIQKRSYQT